MSLVGILKEKEIKNGFKERIIKPKIPYSKEMLVERKSRKYSRIGHAFDYLMQLYLKKHFPNKVTDEVNFVLNRLIPHLINPQREEEAVECSYRLEGRVENYFEDESEDTLINLIEVLLEIALYDIAYRTGINSYIDKGKGVDSNDIKLMLELYELLKEQNFEKENKIKLNVDFNIYEGFLRGAEADLIVSDTLIDIKTSTRKGVTRDTFNQVFGYYILYQLSSMNKKKPKIKNIGIYKARYGEIIKYPIEDIITEEQLNEFINWFVKKIGNRYGYTNKIINGVLKETKNYRFTI